MECCNIFVEVDSEEIKVSSSGLDRSLIVLEDIMEIGSPLCGNRSNLLVTTCISGNKQNRNTFDLEELCQHCQSR